MFFFPVSKWVGGTFYEHSHRLVASAVGFLTVMLAVWLWLKEERRWLRWLGMAALAAVVLQGVLGGLRVTAMKDAIGVFHATLAQVFFALVCAIALVTSPWWVRNGAGNRALNGAAMPPVPFAVVSALVLIQLVLGASMRHQHAGLAIPDFPSAYGKVWPATDGASVAKYNQERGEVQALNPITTGSILLQMTHRAMALVILLSVAWLAGATLRRLGARSVMGRLALAWLGLIVAQACLGAATIWTNKAADIATAHVAVGALSLAAGTVLTLMAARYAQTAAMPEGSSLTREPLRFEARQVRLSA
jgi:cytochrome c oxidase assembly protein subunit 15